MTEQMNKHHPLETDHAPTARVPLWRDELRAQLSLGIPMGLTQLINFLVFTIDVLMIGRLGPEFLAASSLGLVVIFSVWMIFFGPAMAVSPLVSQALGADASNVKDIRRSVRMGLWVVISGFPVILLILGSAESIMLMVGQDPVLAGRAGAYVLTMAPSLMFSQCVLVLRNYLAALDKTLAPLIITAGTTALNGFLNYLLIFGHFGFPKWELVGAGVASSLATMTGFAVLALYVAYQKQSKRFTIFVRFWQPDWERYREILRLGWPITVTTMFEGMLFNVCVLLMGLIGVMEVAAFQVAINVVALAFMLPLGFSMAGSVRVGLAAGAKDLPGIKRASGVTLCLATGMIGLSAIFVASMPDFIAGLYLDRDNADNALVLGYAAQFLKIAALFMLFDAIQVASNQLLRGLKDVDVPMWITGISYWAIGFPVAWWLGLHTKVGANGIWFGLLAGLIAAAFLLGSRLWWKLYKKSAF